MSSFFTRNLKRDYPVCESASGVWLTDTEGRTYLDGCSGAIVSNLGHKLNCINEAINKQLSQVAFAHTSQFLSEPGLELAEQLVELCPVDFRPGAKVYFTCGGSESVETAIKMARGFYYVQGQSERRLLISRWQSYHGNTLGALSATGHPARRKPYQSILADSIHINADYRYRCDCSISSESCNSDACSLKRANELETAILMHGPQNVMAFIAEPIVGATLGAAVPGKLYFKRIREICDKYNVLLIVDEVMTGLGRCAFNFAIEQFGVSPDIITLGKGLASGYLPLGAVLASGKVVEAFAKNGGVFEHGFTYSAHPVSCAAGLASIRYLREHQLVEKVASKSTEFFERLNQFRKFEMVGDIRGRGYLAGIELVSNREQKVPFPANLRISQLLSKHAMKHGLLLYPGSAFLDGSLGDHIMLAPPFTISDAEMDELMKRLELAFKESELSLSRQ
ncbi:MAG: aspartate aminotransferase family protein [Candidatus Obscuribacterales bacterium]|nr:aspartate aminotransferase family protein [Candidatus Obscuribacterales bacterium]